MLERFPVRLQTAMGPMLRQSLSRRIAVRDHGRDLSSWTICSFGMWPIPMRCLRLARHVLRVRPRMRCLRPFHQFRTQRHRAWSKRLWEPISASFAIVLRPIRGQRLRMRSRSHIFLKSTAVIIHALSAMLPASAMGAATLPARRRIS